MPFATPAMRLFFLLAAFCFFNAQAYPIYSTAPRLSAAQLLAHLDQDPRYAKGYLAGVADAAQGRLWCDTGRVKSVELDGIVIANLKALSEQQRQGDAARLALAILARHFPCTNPPKPGG